MAITEQAFGSLTDPYSFVLGNHALRTSWQNSFFLLSDQSVRPVLIGSPGVVVGASAVNVSFSIGSPGIGEQVIYTNVLSSGSATGIRQVYIQDSTAGPHAQVVDATTVTASFLANTLPIATLILDSVGRVQQALDMRPSYLSSAPSLGTMTEVVGSTVSLISGGTYTIDVTKRIAFQNSYYVPRTYSLTALVPQDLNIPTPGFFLGSGSVSLSGNTITTKNTYISCKTSPGLAVNAINQGYIDPATGLLAIRQVATSGVFPANSLFLFEAVTDSVGLIRSLTDFRQSYI
jgi:hypothetical protein